MHCWGVFGSLSKCQMITKLAPTHQRAPPPPPKTQTPLWSSPHQNPDKMLFYCPVLCARGHQLLATFSTITRIVFTCLNHFMKQFYSRYNCIFWLNAKVRDSKAKGLEQRRNSRTRDAHPKRLKNVLTNLNVCLTVSFEICTMSNNAAGPSWAKTGLSVGGYNLARITFFFISKQDTIHPTFDIRAVIDH